MPGLHQRRGAPPGRRRRARRHGGGGRDAERRPRPAGPGVGQPAGQPPCFRPAAPRGGDGAAGGACLPRRVGGGRDGGWTAAAGAAGEPEMAQRRAGRWRQDRRHPDRAGGRRGDPGYRAERRPPAAGDALSGNRPGADRDGGRGRDGTCSGCWQPSARGWRSGRRTGLPPSAAPGSPGRIRWARCCRCGWAAAPRPARSRGASRGSIRPGRCCWRPRRGRSGSWRARSRGRATAAPPWPPA